jgi:outer membrane receptor for monomeric catechols
MLKRLQGFIIGFMVCALLFGGVAFAAELNIIPNPFPVQVNKEPYPIEAYNIDNYTYAKWADVVKAINKAFGQEIVKLNFDQVNSVINLDIDPTITIAKNTQEELTMSESTTPLAEYSAALPEIKSDISMLPEGATFTTYKNCDTAVLYNGETYLSKDDLALKFGIRYKSIDVKAGAVTYTNGTQDVVIVLDDNIATHFFDKKGLGYYNINLFTGMLGD